MGYDWFKLASPSQTMVDSLNHKWAWVNKGDPAAMVIAAVSWPVLSLQKYIHIIVAVYLASNL